MLEHFDSFEVDEINPVFRPQRTFNSKLYSSFWSLYKQDDSDSKYFFERHCSGLKLAPSSLFIHTDEPILFRRSSEIAHDNISVDSLIQRWYTGQDRPPNMDKFTPAVRASFKNELANRKSDAFVLYSYRPMLNMSALISEDILKTLAKSPGGGTRYRPEIVNAYKDPRTFGIAIAASPKELDEKLNRFASFCWYLPDNDLSKRGNAHIFCNYFPSYKGGQDAWDSTPRLNLGHEIMTILGDQSPDKIVFYVYAILCSDAYLDAFEPALFNSTGEQPRIPVPKTKRVFNEIALLGEELALLEKHVPDEEIRINDTYANYQEIHGEFKLYDFYLDAANEMVVLKASDRTIVIKPVPREVLKFKVGGYQVLYQWLKVHKHTYTRTCFTKRHMKRLLRVIQSIEKQSEIVNRLNSKVQTLLNSLTSDK